MNQNNFSLRKQIDLENEIEFLKGKEEIIKSKIKKLEKKLMIIKRSRL